MSVFPITFEDKVDSPEFTAWLATFGAEKKMTAAEINLVRDALNELHTTKVPIVGGKIPTEYLPTYVDDVLEFANLASFPVTGESGKIYLALDTNKTYRWSGSVYVQIGGINQDLYPIKYWYQATGVGLIQTYGTNAIAFQGTQSDVTTTGLSYRKIVSAPTVGASIYLRESVFNRVPPNKGYQFLLRFRIADAATISNVRGFHGLQITSGFSNTEISANTQPMCGIGCDGTDTNIHIFSRQVVFGTLVKIDTGFSKTLNHEYLLTQERLPNSNDVVFTLKNLTSSTVFKSTVVNNLFTLTIVNHRNNNTSILSCGFEIQRIELNLSE